MKKIVKGWECTWFSRKDFAHEDKKKLANEMGMFFTKKIADIRLDLDNHDKQQASTDRVSNGIKTDSLLFKLSSVSRSARPGSNIQ